MVFPPAALAPRRWPTLLRWPIALLAVWGMLILVVGTAGEFPLNDDWAYAIPVKTFLDTGRIVPLEWTWTPLVTQVLLGAAGAKLLGYSHETLRIVTLVCGMVAVFGTYALARRLSASSRQAAFVAALLLVNPVFVNLSFTFMLDVPFTALLVLSMYGVVCSVECSDKSFLVRAGYFLFGATAMLMATLSRQTGVAVAGAVVGALGLTGLMRRSLTPRATFALVAAAVSLPALYLAVKHMVDVGDIRRIAALDFLLWQLSRPHLSYTIAVNVIGILTYLGLFLSPLVVLRVLSGHVDRRTWWMAVPAVGVGLVATRYLGLPMPPGYNVIYNMGLGPLTLVGELAPVQQLPRLPLWGLHAFCLLSAVLTVLLLLQDAWGSERFRRNMSYPILLLFPLIYLLPQLPRIPFFDRYLLPVVPPLAVALLLLARKPYDWSRARLGVPLAMMAGLLVYGAVGTRDYMNYQRGIRAVAAELQQARNISPEFIDAGFEHWGWHAFADGQSPGDGYNLPRPGRRPFVLSFLPEVYGYKRVDKHILHSELLQRDIPLYTHERLPRTPPAPGMMLEF